VSGVKNPNIKQIMSKVRSFPGMPATAGKLLPMLKDPDTDNAKIEDVLRYDPGLTANILKLTNSAYFGIPTKVSSVRQAIMLLGWKRLIQLVMTMCMSDLMKDSVAGYDLPKGELWRHSIAVSVASDVLVRGLEISEADEVFTAALLHDIGKLVLGDYVKEDMPKIDAMVAKGISFEVAEYIVLGTDHAEIGANILKNWSFPIPLVEAVHWHHDPNSCSGHCLMSDIVHIADILGQMAGYGQKRDDREPAPISEVLERLGLARDDLAYLAGQTAERVEAINDALS
jgi:putative nucleotidyltransferase with HDIG domain